MLGIDDKYLGRRGIGATRFVTIVSDLSTGEPLAHEPARPRVSSAASAPRA